jgi:hypothetical protein
MNLQTLGKVDKGWGFELVLGQQRQVLRQVIGV